MESSLNDIEKTIKGSKKTPKLVEYANTGCFLMDILVGGGEGKGYPLGKIVNIVGDKSSGKTFIACELIAACYYKFGSKNFKWVYDDSESGFSFDTAKLYGFEIMPLDESLRVKSDTVEDAYINVRTFFESLKENEVGIYVIDSLDGLASEEANELADERFKAAKKGKEFNKGSYKMGKARYLSQEFFPQLAKLIKQKNGLLVVISQIRQNINPMSFEKYVRAGGSAMDFYCHTVMWLANINKLKKKGRAVGITVKAKNTKSKTPRPYREMFFQLVFDYGMDSVSTSVDFLFDFRTEKGELIKGAEASWDGKEPTIENLKQFLTDNNAEEEYRNTVNQKLKKLEVMEWLEEHPVLSEKYKKEFVSKMSREELISYIEDNNLVDELNKRVEEKWEIIEASIATTRKPKYSSNSQES